MPKGPTPTAVTVTDDERRHLTSLAHRSRSAPQISRRARIILACANGDPTTGIAKRRRVSPTTVCKWRTRFLADRIEGLADEQRPGAPRRVTDEQVEQVVVRTLETTPQGVTHWSTRGMAEAMGLSHMTISRIWHAFGLQPHRTETFKLSPDPWLVEKVRDIVGLYVNPPEHAVVLCVDEKPQIQALDRTAPLLPMQPGQPERRTYDYRRHGTTALFAALDVKTGNVIGALHRRHRAIEFEKFLKRIDTETPADLDIHLILDNYSTHKAPRIRRWLAGHPRFHLHFTPTYSSWLNLVERWCVELTTKQPRRGVYRSVVALEPAIREFLAQHNATSRPFVWTKTADEIAAGARRGRSGRRTWPPSSPPATGRGVAAEEVALERGRLDAVISERTPRGSLALGAGRPSRGGGDQVPLVRAPGLVLDPACGSGNFLY